MSIVVPKGTRWMFENLLPNDKDKILEMDSQKQDINTEVSKEDLNNVWTDEFGVIYSTDMKYLIEGPVKETQKGVHIWKTGVLINSYTIPDGVLSICDKAFFDCRYLISIKCPDSLMAIGTSAFQNCWDLKEVNLGHNIMKIGNKAFKNCKSLHSIYIPESLTYVAKDSFEDSGLNIIYTNYGDRNRIESMLPNYKDIIEELPF